MIWPHLREELYSFLEALNNVHETLKFTSKISQNRADFLDVTVAKDEHGHIQTSLYTKPTDAHMYLHFSSYHPKHKKSSIPYSQVIRLRRICRTPELYQDAAQKLSENLRIRGYLKGLVKEAVDMAFQKNRSELLRTHTGPENKKENVIPFTITFNPYNPPIKRILQNNIRILQTAGDLKPIIESKFMVVNRRATNIRQLLIKSDIKLQCIPRGSGPCNTPCTTCPFMKQSTYFKCHVTKQKVPIKGSFNYKQKT